MAVTLALGMRAPLGSVTCPLRVERNSCAERDKAIERDKATAIIARIGHWLDFDMNAAVSDICFPLLKAAFLDDS
jgi:hypothetical protein